MSYEPALAVRAAAAAAAPAGARSGAAPAGAPAPSLGAEAARGTPAACGAAGAAGGRRSAGCGGVGGPWSRHAGALSCNRTCRCGTAAAERIAGAAAGASGAASPAVRAPAPLTGCASRSAATTAATRSSATTEADGAGPGSPAPAAGHAVPLACSGVACARGCRGVSVRCPRCAPSRRSPLRDAPARRACESKGTLPSRLVCKLRRMGRRLTDAMESKNAFRGRTGHKPLAARCCRVGRRQAGTCRRHSGDRRAGRPAAGSARQAPALTHIHRQLANVRCVACN